jgi:eukaryotic-like serine/threonine-protein kinase
MELQTGKTIAGYEILEVLGGSKFGVAYKVKNVFAQRVELLKVLPKSLQADEEQVARFLREIKVHARLAHPNIVSFYNAREIEGQLVMTTEYVPGLTVAERVESGPMPWREAVRCASDALTALEHAHTSGIVHRGLTSSCLVITTEKTTRLGGFGLAKAATDPQLTAVGTVVGPLRYISPEQVKGAPVDQRCDLYSMGVILYEMLTGKLPFDSKGQFDIMLAHVNTTPKHPSDVNPDVPRELGDLVLKAMAKEPEQRFQSAQEFRTALEPFGGRPITEPLAPASEAQAADIKPESNGQNHGVNGTALPEPVEVHAEPVQVQPEPVQLKPAEPMVAAAADSQPAEARPADAAEAVVEPGPVVANRLLPKLGISLAAGLITLILGSAAILALLAITRP